MQFQPPPGQQPPVYQPREDDWGSARHAHKRIDELEDKLGDIKADIATIRAGMLTEDKLMRILDRDRREETTYRRWEDDRVTQLRGYPAEQREQRSLGYMADQSHSFRTQAQMSLYTPFISALLSLLVSLLVVKLL